MREHEMRIRIEQFLKTRMRGMLAPALGLGIAVVGCKQESVTPVYSAPLTDGSFDKAAQILPDARASSPDVPLVDVPLGEDTSSLASDTSPPNDKDALGEVSLPEAGKEAAGSEAGTDAKDSGVDFKKDFGFEAKYFAQFPDGGGVIALYMARMPDTDS